MKSRLFIILSLIITTTIKLNAQAGALDVDFDNDGKVTTAIGIDEKINSIAVQTDEKILTAGYTANLPGKKRIALVRYKTNGSVDSTFDGDGIVITQIDTSCEARSVIIQPDGKIICAGFSYDSIRWDFALVRYNIDGSLDNTFDSDGIVNTSIGTWYSVGTSAVLQNDNKILVAGYSYNGSNSDFTVVRYNTDGTLDNSFDGDGIVTTDFSSNEDICFSITIQSDEKILLGGYSFNGVDYDFSIARYNIDGTLDNSFDGDGKIVSAISTNDDMANTIAMQPDGKILLGGRTGIGIGSNFVIIRYSEDGTLDYSFALDGILTTNLNAVEASLSDIIVQPDSKILVAGYTNSLGYYQFGIARFYPDGNFDESFDDDGILATDVGITGFGVINSIQLQADGKLIAGGYSFNGIDVDFELARYITDLDLGIVNFSINNNSLLIYPNPITQEATLSYTLQNQEEITIDLINSQGQLVYNIIRNELQETGDHQQKIKFPTDLLSGIYYLVISNMIGKVSIKLAK